MALLLKTPPSKYGEASEEDGNGFGRCLIQLIARSFLIVIIIIIVIHRHQHPI